MTPRSSLSYLILGPVQALGPDGEPLPIGGAQRRAVLAQLVLAGGRTVSVDALCTGLWGDEHPPTATKAIQIHLSKLRQALVGAELVTRAPGYALVGAGAGTDLTWFEAAVAAAADERAAGRPDVAADRLRAALELWRGAPLADVDHFPFAEATVARLEEAHQHAVEERIAADLAAGRHALLIGELEAMVRAHPLRERPWAMLMTALYRDDRQADALEVYRRARHGLVEQLGLEPGPELQLLERRILDQSLDRRPEGAGGSSPAAVLEPNPRLQTAGPVVGRDAPLAVLRRSIADAEAGRGGIVAVCGDEGIGKSTVIAELVQTLDRPVTVVAGRAGEHLVAPFGAWVDVLRGLGAAAELDLVVGVDGGTPGEGGANAGDQAPERNRLALFDGVVAHLRARARERPVLVVLDDLHWVDDGSVALLLHALGELESDRVLFVVAWRDREVAAGHPVTHLDHRMTRVGSPRLDLQPLDHTDIVALITGAHDEVEGAAVDDVASRVLGVTGGVPLFVTEVLADLGDGDRPFPHPDDVASEAPTIVRTLVTRRLTGAGPRATEVAAACSVLSEPILPLLAHHVARGADVGETLVALDALVAAGILRDDPFGYAFVHDTFRDAIDATLRTGGRQRLHAAALEALRHEPVGPAVLAHHAEQAGPLVDDAEVIELLRRAGADAVQRGAFSDAASVFGRAVDRSRADGRAPLLLELADALWRAGDIAAAKDIALQVVNQASTGAVADGLVADAVVLHATFGAGYGIDPDSVAAAGDALARVDDPEQRARILIAGAAHHAMWGSPAPLARDAVRRARVATPPGSSDEVMGELLFAESLALVGAAELDRRVELADRLVEIGARTGSLRVIGRGLRMRCLAQMSAGHLDDLDRTLGELVDIADRTGSWLYRSDAWRWRIAAALASGDDGRAAADLAELERVSASPLAGRAFAGTQHLLLSRSTGDLDRCLALVDGLRSVLPDDPAVAPDRRLADLFRLVILVELGRVDEAEAGFDDLRTHLDLDQSACRRYQGELAFTAQLVADLEHPELARPLLDRLEPYRGQLLVLSWGEGILGAADRYLAGLDALLGGELADAAFERALELEDEAGAPVEVARTRDARGRAVDRVSRHHA